MSADTPHMTRAEVMTWLENQAGYVTPTEHHLLWALVSHAWYDEERAEEHEPGARVGQVMRGKSKAESIRARTGLSLSTIHRGLKGLQSKGYVLVTERPEQTGSRHREPQRIEVFWTPGADERRDLARRGIEPLPAGFLQSHKRYTTRADLGENVVPFRKSNRSG